MDRDIQAYVQSCYQCQGNKPSRQTARSPLNPILPPGACWRLIGVDLIVELPKTPEGFNAIAVFVDHLSKMVRLIPTDTNLTAEGFAKLFFVNIFPHYGMPEQIISDRGLQWNNELFKAICDYADIRLTLSTAYHPQTNGLVERSNEMVETALRHYVAADLRDWNDKLPFIEFALNSTKKDSTGTTPFHMNRITIPKNPFQAVVSNVALNTSIKRKSPITTWMGLSEPSGHRTAVQANLDYLFARQCVELAKCRMKQTHDSKGIRHHFYQPGDKVWLSYKHISLRHPTKRNKLVPRFFGRVQVLRTVGLNAVELDLPRFLRIHPTVPVSLLKPFKERAGVNQPIVINGSTEYELEAILQHKITGKKAPIVEFEVLWKGDFDTTWQEFDDFENSMESLESYLLTKCSPTKRDIIRRSLTPKQLNRLSPNARKAMTKQPKRRRTEPADLEGSPTRRRTDY
jgi:hypothetical protein